MPPWLESIEDKWPNTCVKGVPEIVSSFPQKYYVFLFRIIITVDNEGNAKSVFKLTDLITHTYSWKDFSALYNDFHAKYQRMMKQWR